MTKNKCLNCGEVFEKTAHNKKFCSARCGAIYRGEIKSKGPGRKKGQRFPNGYKKNKNIKKLNNLKELNNPQTMQVKYDVSNGIKFLNRLAELAEKVVDSFNMLRLETYSEATQNSAIELIIRLIKFLEDQIRGGEIIEYSKE